MRDRISSYVPEPYILYWQGDVKDRVTPTMEWRQDELTSRPGQQAPEMQRKEKRTRWGWPLAAAVVSKTKSDLRRPDLSRSPPMRMPFQGVDP
jgi:hypothetical protein